MRLPQTLVLVFLLDLLAQPLLAQSPNGSINGLVLDPSNRVIVGADILVINDVTGVKYTSKTNDDGIYMVSNLPPAPYRLQVSKVGFKTIVKPDIVLNVQDALSINFTLPIGALHEVVTVEGGAPLVNTETAAVSTVVDRQFAENLPMNGRSFQTLIYLTPGVVVTTSTQNDNGQFSINGQRAASNYWMVDGVSANIGVSASFSPGNGFGGALGSFSTMGGTNSLVSVDAMQEFRIQTSTFAPEFGRTPGGQISIVTRSGTNRVHGTAFDYLRNDVFDANNWFADLAGLPKAKERQNDFGGTFSGPILRDKAFFFFSYEGLRLRLPQTSLTSVPDISARQAADAAMQPYLNAYPLPNGADNAGAGIAEFNASYSNPGTLDAVSLRIDHKPKSNLSVFGRYNYSPSSFVERGATLRDALSTLERFEITTQTATAGLTWLKSPTLANDLRFNYSRTNAKSQFSLDAFRGAVPLASLPFPPPFSGENGLLVMSISSLGTGAGLSSGLAAHNLQRQLNIVDSVSWQKGSHGVKFGIDVRHLSPITSPFQYEQSVAFDDVPGAESGNAEFVGVFAASRATFLFNNLGAYVQDTWHALPRLTLTYGLRWDVDFSPTSANGPSIPSVSGYNLSDLSQLTIAKPGTPAFKTTYGNFAPRVGLAYQFSQNDKWQTVLRGGFGVFYDLASAETGNLLSFQFPPFGASAFFGGPFPLTPSEAAPPAIPSTGSLSSFYGFNPNLKLPYTLQWNASFEQSLGKQQTLTLSYVGASGRRLLQTTAVFNPPTNPNIGIAELIDNSAASEYHAFQFQFQRRLLRGLQVLSSYTWSHSIDDASASSTLNSSNLGVPGSANVNRGNSDFDIRHAVTAGLTFEIPAPRGRAALNLLLRGWSTENFVLVRTAPPVDVSDVHFFELNSAFTNVRPDVVPGQPFYLYGAQYPGSKALNPAALTDPPVDSSGNPTRQGNLGRNLLRAVGAAQWDFAVHRDFVIHEPWKLQFRAELFNAPNHPNFGPPFNEFGAGGFGLSTQMLGQSLSGAGGSGSSGSFNPLYQIGGPRSIQLALKLVF